MLKRAGKILAFFLEMSIKNTTMQQQPYVEKPGDTRKEFTFQFCVSLGTSVSNLLNTTAQVKLIFLTVIAASLLLY